MLPKEVVGHLFAGCGGEPRLVGHLSLPTCMPGSNEWGGEGGHRFPACDPPPPGCTPSDPPTACKCTLLYARRLCAPALLPLVHGMLVGHMWWPSVGQTKVEAAPPRQQCCPRRWWVTFLLGAEVIHGWWVTSCCPPERAGGNGS